MSHRLASTPIVPMLLRRRCRRIAAMMAEAFRAPGERMPIARPRRSSAWSAPRSRPCCSGTTTRTSFGVVARRQLRRCSSTCILVRRRHADDGVLGADVIEREQLPAGEYYALMLFAIAGMMLMATATDLLVIFLALEVLSLAVYVLTGIRRDSAAGDRGGVQVLPARRVLERVLPLRHRVHLRR